MGWKYLGKNQYSKRKNTMLNLKDIEEIANHAKQNNMSFVTLRWGGGKSSLYNLQNLIAVVKKKDWSCNKH